MPVVPFPSTLAVPGVPTPVAKFPSIIAVPAVATRATLRTLHVQTVALADAPPPAALSQVPAFAASTKVATTSPDERTCATAGSTVAHAGQQSARDGRTKAIAHSSRKFSTDRASASKQKALRPRSRMFLPLQRSTNRCTRKQHAAIILYARLTVLPKILLRRARWWCPKPRAPRRARDFARWGRTEELGTKQPGAAVHFVVSSAEPAASVAAFATLSKWSRPSTQVDVQQLANARSRNSSLSPQRPLPIVEPTASSEFLAAARPMRALALRVNAQLLPDVLSRVEPVLVVRKDRPPQPPPLPRPPPLKDLRRRAFLVHFTSRFAASTRAPSLASDRSAAPEFAIASECAAQEASRGPSDCECSWWSSATNDYCCCRPSPSPPRRVAAEFTAINDCACCWSERSNRRNERRTAQHRTGRDACVVQNRSVTALARSASPQQLRITAAHGRVWYLSARLNCLRADLDRVRRKGVCATVQGVIGWAHSHSWFVCESTTDSGNRVHWLHARDELYSNRESHDDIAPAAGAQWPVVVQCCTHSHALGVAWVATLALGKLRNIAPRPRTRHVMGASARTRGRIPRVRVSSASRWVAPDTLCIAAPAVDFFPASDCLIKPGHSLLFTPAE